MSDGATHARIAIAVEAGLAAQVVTSFFPLDFSIGLMVGGVVGIIITPDIDHDKRTREENRFYAIGRPFGILWQVLWSPYPVIYRHRGISHFPILGTITRVLHILIIASIIAKFGWDLWPPDFIGPLLITYGTRFWLGVFCGWCTQDIVHYFTDIISTSMKRRLSRRHAAYGNRSSL